MIEFYFAATEDMLNINDPRISAFDYNLKLSNMYGISITDNPGDLINSLYPFAGKIAICKATATAKDIINIIGTFLAGERGVVPILVTEIMWIKNNSLLKK